MRTVNRRGVRVEIRGAAFRPRYSQTQTNTCTAAETKIDAEPRRGREGTLNNPMRGESANAEPGELRCGARVLLTLEVQLCSHPELGQVAENSGSRPRLRVYVPIQQDGVVNSRSHLW